MKRCAIIQQLCRCVPWVVASVLLSTSAWGQVRLGPQGVIKSSPPAANTVPPPAKPADESRERTISVDGAAETQPAFKYALVVPLYDREPGNAVSWYYRCFERVAAQQEIANELAGLLEQPTESWNEEQVSEKLANFATVFEELEIAIHRSNCDWDLQLEKMLGPRLFEITLAEFQNARSVARLLAVKARWEIKRGDFAAAAKTLRQGYHLGRDIARVPILINALIGIAITQTMNNEVVHWIEAPGSPNLYWSLAELSQPPIDMREALQNELNWPARMFPMLNRAETEQLSDAGWQQELRRLAQDLSRIMGNGGPTTGMNEWLLAGLVAKGYPRARRDLITQGMPENEVDNMPAARVVAIHQSRLMRSVADELWKVQVLPVHLTWQQWRNKEKDLETHLFRDDQGEILPIMSTLLPAISTARRAEARCWSDVNQLQVIEALRMHMASNERLPAQLSEVNVVPVPDNPVTDAPYAYQNHGTHATLDSGFPPEAGFPAGYSWKFEISRRVTPQR